MTAVKTGSYQRRGVNGWTMYSLITSWQIMITKLNFHAYHISSELKLARCGLISTVWRRSHRGKTWSARKSSRHWKLSTSANKVWRPSHVISKWWLPNHQVEIEHESRQYASASSSSTLVLQGTVHSSTVEQPDSNHILTFFKSEARQGLTLGQSTCRSWSEFDTCIFQSQPDFGICTFNIQSSFNSCTIQTYVLQLDVR